jgi:hypothetical protein
VPNDAASCALILDVDGVVSPVHGSTAWGDDVVAGQLFGPVLVSPTLCGKLDRLAQQPKVTVRWLTSWSAEMRAALSPFPGRTWPEITSGPDDPDLGWWKWAALNRWLDDRSIRRLAWCDDHLTDPDLGALPPRDADRTGATRATDVPAGISVIQAALAQRGITALLLAPRTSVGLTPHQVDVLERFLTLT